MARIVTRVREVQRYSVVSETGFVMSRGHWTRADAQALVDIFHSSGNGSFHIIEGKPETFFHYTDEEILDIVAEELQFTTTVTMAMLDKPFKRNGMKGKMKPFKFSYGGYQTGKNGVEHDPVWLNESVLKNMGGNLLKRLSGSKRRHKPKTFHRRFTEFRKENPLATFSQLVKFARRSGGLSARQGRIFVINTLKREKIFV